MSKEGEQKRRNEYGDSNLFICWSGEMGRHVAKQLKEWFESLKIGVKPTYSEDFSKGERWWSILREQLGAVRAGIVCLTPGSLGSPWLHYEAGQLAADLAPKTNGKGQAIRRKAGIRLERRKVFPFLFRVAKSELVGPLSAYQATIPTCSEVELLLDSLQSALNCSKPFSIQAAWEKLDKRLAKIPYESMQEIFPDLERRFRRKTFDEPIDECVSQKWKDRFAGAHVTLDLLKERQPEVRRRAAPHVAQCYDELVAELDYYADGLGAEFLCEQRFEKRKSGRLKLPEDLASESRRKRVRSMFIRVLNPLGAPVLPEARLYEHYRLDSEDSCAQLWQVAESAWAARRSVGSKANLKRMREWEASAWAFDRIVYYSAVPRNAVESDELGEKLLEATRREVEILWTYQESFGVGTLDPRPLYFALSALEKALEDGCTIDASLTEKLLTKVRELAKEIVQATEDNRLRDMLIKKIKRVRKNIQERPTD